MPRQARFLPTQAAFPESNHSSQIVKSSSNKVPYVQSFVDSSFFPKMKSAPCLWAVLSLAMLAGAIPAISNRALWVPLQRRSSNAGARVGPVRSGKSCKPHQLRSRVCFLFPRHSLCSVSRATFRKYANTLTAYEGNTGSRHPLDMRSRSSSTGPPKRASSGTVDRHNQEADLYGARSIGMPPQDSRGETSSIRTVFLISSPSISGHRYG